MTWPKTTCSTSARDTLLRSSTDRKTSAPRSQGGTFLRPPPKSPTAVRQAPTTRTSSIRVSRLTFILPCHCCGQQAIVTRYYAALKRNAAGLSSCRVQANKEKLLVLVFFRGRSEEHTSELQSLMGITYAVICL